MKPTLQLKLSQQLTLTPQLQQAIKLLQLSTLEMNQEVERLLLENPLLEREESGEEEPAFQQESADAAPAESQETASSLDDDWFEGEATSYSGEASGDDEVHEFQPSQGPNLREHLHLQLGVMSLTDRDRNIVSMLIDALDDNGYLSIGLEELLELLPAELGIGEDDLSIALCHLQHMDPTGVGARSLSECLSLQLKALPASAVNDLAQRIVEKHLEGLAAHDFTRMKKILGCSDEELRAAKNLITQLNPRPGSEFSSQVARYIIPDVIVEKVKGEWHASLNPEAIPKLRVNKMYADILQRGHENGQQIGQQLQEAKWLIRNVQQRFETILKVSQAIVARQHNFLEHGEVAMRPLVLREIADEVGMHESTVSRVTTQKFMFTPRGIFELKYFFGSHVATEAGGACSSTAIRAIIKQLVGTENPKSPLSDSQISEILGKQGIVVARRTIAKYRESLKIPPVNLRKSL
ncbi:MAG: RNA polymerase factor sigma-54 [Burkholderiales bacterium]|nr:RNA polymerase factor sigma-54 [Burkholderiales bacterium]